MEQSNDYFQEEEFNLNEEIEYPENLKEGSHLLINTGRIFYKHYFESERIRQHFNYIARLNRQMKNQKRGFDMLNENLRNHSR